MRLLNVHTLTLELFSDPVPESTTYATLSHTWEHEEVSFDDMKDPLVAGTKLGFAKIRSVCKMAADLGLRYIWVDTCCIDKSSSAELSEAINSMFRWYEKSAVCIAYLSDLPTGQTIDQPALEKCRWFTRGWTLQELIAPKNLVFVDQLWTKIGTKSDLKIHLENITNISRRILDGSSPLSSVSIAKRMSWAAKRETTRIEDKAYCLLGVFEVNMPMIYGEGLRAFTRLQEEILRLTTDLSIFAWQALGDSEYRGILADSPAEFKNCGSIELINDQFRFRDEISLTNRGVKIHTPIRHVSHEIFILDLHCHRLKVHGDPRRLAIYLKRALDTFYRASPESVVVAAPEKSAHLARTIFLARTVNEDTLRLLSDSSERRINIKLPEGIVGSYVHSISAVPEVYWEPQGRYFSLRQLPDFVCFVRFSVTACVTSYSPANRKIEPETTSFILVCHLVGGSKLNLGLHAESRLQDSLELKKSMIAINPFTSIEDHGPLGDPFSLAILHPEEMETQGISLKHGESKHNYVLRADVDKSNAPHFKVSVGIDITGLPRIYRL